MKNERKNNKLRKIVYYKGKQVKIKNNIFKRKFMEIKRLNWSAVRVNRITLSKLDKISKKYNKPKAEIIKELVDTEYDILESDIKTYGNFKIEEL